MYTLGIETSCDETSVSVIKNRKVYSCKTLSSLKFHKKYGGIIPEIASRRHLEFIDKVTVAALSEAGLKPGDIGLVSVTQGPGLVGSLLVGFCFAKALAFSLKIPILGINHLHAHLYACFLNKGKAVFPFIGLVASGGHTEIYKVLDFDKINVIGRTEDDASGEALDKVGRYYGLGFPAAPAIDKLYRDKFVDKNLFKIKRRESLNFSFSGIKTKAVHLHNQLKGQKKLSDKKIAHILSSFQFTVVESLINNLTRALKKFKIGAVACGGGVIANRLLRQRLHVLERKYSTKLFLPEPEFCQDNAACVAGLGEYLYKKGYTSSLDMAPFLR